MLYFIILIKILLYKIDLLQMDTEFNTFSFYNKTELEGVDVFFKLGISQNVLVEIATNLQENIQCGTNIRGKIFAIFIELAQNVHFHSAERQENQGCPDKGVGMLSVGENATHYLLSSGNKIDNDKITTVLNRCEHINSLSKENLRAFYRAERKVPRRSNQTRGAYLGLIEMARRSQNPLDIQIEQLDEQYSFISVFIKICKPLVNSITPNHSGLTISDMP